jgi:hypothetical protein
MINFEQSGIRKHLGIDKPASATFYTNNDQTKATPVPSVFAELYIL